MSLLLLFAGASAEQPPIPPGPSKVFGRAGGAPQQRQAVQAQSAQRGGVTPGATTARVDDEKEPA